MVAGGNGRVIVFDADSDTVLGSVQITGAAFDCAITPDLTTGFVVDFTSRVWVIDLTQDPPVLAGGTNPIPISNPGEDVAVTPDGRFLLVSDGGVPTPVSVVDIALRAEIDTLAVDFNHNSVDVCDDGGTVLVTSFSGSAHRLELDGTGMLSPTGEVLLAPDPNNVHCAPGSLAGVVISRDSGELRSFLIDGMASVDLRLLGDFGLSAAFQPNGERVFVRTTSRFQAFDFDPDTGTLGAGAVFNVPAGDVNADTFFGVDWVAVHPNGTKVYVSQLSDPEVTIHDTDGTEIGSITHPDLVAPRGVCVQFRPCIVLDFETEDDLATPLVNGQHIDTEFGTLLSITSTGSNAGLGIFDSSVGGPNDPSQDRDLLIDSGNILILQTENFPPDANDVFPRPNDDDDGGTITFALAIPLEPLSLRLIDLDAGDGTSTVVLTDGSLRQRTYTLPGNWTGDLTSAEPGEGTLDLTLLGPQPGFGSVATAVEDGGFDPGGVVRIDVVLDGSAGLDDLILCPGELPRAAANVRNGSGVNPGSLSTVSRPVLGTTFAAELDCTAQGPGLAVLEIRRHASGGSMTPYGEVLVGGALLRREVRAHPGNVNPFVWDIPLDLSLWGLDLHVQGACRIPSTFSAPKRMQAGSQLSNALDLILGLY